jgi:hypothetical protein
MIINRPLKTREDRKGNQGLKANNSKRVQKQSIMIHIPLLIY